MRMTKGDEAMARMLNLLQREGARKSFFAVCTKQRFASIRQPRSMQRKNSELRDSAETARSG